MMRHYIGKLINVLDTVWISLQVTELTSCHWAEIKSICIFA